MAYLKSTLARLISAPGESRLQRILLAPLAVLSFLYGGVLNARVFLYRTGVYKTRSLPCKVVSVGNLTLGGTGKTPFVALVAGIIRQRGFRAAVLSRGYGGKFQGACGVVSDGERILMNPRLAGDEPCLLAEKLPGTPVLIGKERRVPGRLAADRFQPDVVVLDDGFQHLALRRDLDLLLVDSSCPFGNRKVFPRGVLREPLNQVKRADAIILTKAGGGARMDNLEKEISDLAGAIPIFRVDYLPGPIRVLGRGGLLGAETLRGRRVLGFAGIARPESFEKTLLRLESKIAGFEVFPDHHEYRREDLERLQDLAAREGVEALVTTEKDLVRLADMAGSPEGVIPIWALSVRHVFEKGGQPRFEDFLWKRLGLE